MPTHQKTARQLTLLTALGKPIVSVICVSKDAIPTYWAQPKVSSSREA
jgi:hypothetical protein